MRRLLTGIGIFLLIVLLWGLVEPRLLLDTQETVAPIPGLPERWEGRRIALLADLQIGMWLDNDAMVRRSLRRAVQADPALILIAGDFVYHPDSATVRRAVELVRPAVEAGRRVVAVLGNHDFGVSEPDDTPDAELAAYLESRLEEIGVTVLENESILVDGLYVVGLGSVWADRSRPDAALVGVPDGSPRVVFMHNPIAFRDLPARSAPLALAAHTHGGQIRVPMTPSSSWLEIALAREVIADGWAIDSVGAPGNELYVNRGIGFSTVPIRFLCSPELTLIELTSAGPAPAGPTPIGRN